MSSPFAGQIMIFAGNYAPAGWALCQGQLLPVAENEQLFQAIGTTYGGDSVSTFALPDLRGRVPLNVSGENFTIGQPGGQEAQALSAAAGQPHPNMMPSLALDFCIRLNGPFPGS